jgi:acyl carrier protein
MIQPLSFFMVKKFIMRIYRTVLLHPGAIMHEISEDILQFLKTHGFLHRKNTLGEHESLTDAGAIDSIGLLQLVDYLESRYAIEIPLEIITPENFDTLAGISQTVLNLKTA